MKIQLTTSAFNALFPARPFRCVVAASPAEVAAAGNGILSAASPVGSWSTSSAESAVGRSVFLYAAASGLGYNKLI